MSIDLGPENEQVVLVLFGTGIRSYSSGVSVRIGSIDATVLAAQAQAEYVGLDQVNVLLPRELAGRGEVDLLLTADGKQANVVRIHIR